MRVRDNARAILINPEGRVLLEKIDVDIFDPAGKIRSPYWLTPGGAIEFGETPAQAVAREIWEECGIERFEVGPMVWFCEHPLVIFGSPILSRDHYFLVKTADSRVSRDGMEYLEWQMHCEDRWWLASEILASPEVFAPPNLGTLLQQLFSGRAALSRPVSIPW